MLQVKFFQIKQNYIQGQRRAMYFLSRKYLHFFLVLPGIQVKLNELVTEESRQKKQNVYVYVLFLLTKGSPIEYLTTDGTKVIHP